MSKMISLFDYIFYRIYGFFKEKGDGIPETAGTLLLSLIQFFTILGIMVMVRMIYNYSFPANKYYFLLPLILLGVINWYRYEWNFDIGQFDVKWKDEEEKRKVRNGWLIGLYLLVSFLVPAVYGFLK
jgi:hypothetical protein